MLQITLLILSLLKARFNGHVCGHRIWPTNILIKRRHHKEVRLQLHTQDEPFLLEVIRCLLN